MCIHVDHPSDAVSIRFRDVEATLLLGIKRKAYPLGKLNQILQEYKSTGSLHFDANQHNMDYYQTASTINQQDMHATNVRKSPLSHVSNAQLYYQ